MNPQTQDASSPAPSTIQVATTAVAANGGVGPNPGKGQAYPPAAGAHQPPEGPMAKNNQEALGVGTEGETTVWTGGYSLKNFIPRIVVRIALTAVWLVLLSYLGDAAHYPGKWDWSMFVWLTGAALALYWIMLCWQMILARMGHRYELTNRRLFVDTGVFRHRRDQMELLRVQDVYVKQQGLFYRLLNLGTVVIESSEERLPVHYLPGVSDPNAVMDRIWHYARMERDLRSVKVDQV
jgi:membrane protein YdbS with pleckstrin-like domain